MAAQGPLIVIVGLTASGKSDVALKLAQKYHGEIISADSWTVYKGFDIGSAKPTPQERQTVPYHLIDVADAADGFNAAIFKKLANQAIADIQKRGKVPFLVGGTGLYVDSVIFDYGFLPTLNDERQRLNKLSLNDLIKEAKNKKISLAGVDTRNKRRLIRAIETGGLRPAKSQLRPNTLVIGLKLEPEHLRAKIESRVDQMLKAGLKSEVKSLAAKYGWQVEPMKGIGYQQWQDYFEGTQSLEITRQRIINATYQLAKRQMTWFKRNSNILWIDGFEQADEAVQSFLNNNLLQ